MSPETHHNQQLNIFFFPFMAQGHMIPMIDMAKLFSSRGAKTAIITTPHNANLISKWLDQTNNSTDLEIATHIIRFPAEESGLPENYENLDQTDLIDLGVNFFLATRLLQQPLEELLQSHRPDCLVSDAFLPWTTDAAAKFGVPRIVFHGICFFSQCCFDVVRVYKPYKNVSSDTEKFLIPNLPDEIELTRMQLPDFVKQELDNEFSRFLGQSKESELKSYGAVVNSFYELEPAYADHYRKIMGRKAWHIGPVSLCNLDNVDKGQRGQTASIDEHECLKWLNSKKPNSVVYVCFGSTSNFPAAQLLEIAIGLEASGNDFIWVVRSLGVKKEGDKDEEEDTINGEKWLPEGFEKRMEGKGLIIQGWAPQVLILDHESIGGFVTHCGWNSILESICAGVPMVTWPVFADQFYNEKLVTQILKIGVAVGAKEWTILVGDSVKRDMVEKAVSRIMVGEEAEEMRSRAKAFGGMARKAIEEGGSSYCDLNALMEDLRLHNSASK